MEPPQTCQSCRKPADASGLEYRRGERVICHGALLQCDLCERYACSHCMGVYDILSGYDFLCRDCSRQVDPSGLRAIAAQNPPDRTSESKELAVPTRFRRRPRTRGLDT